MYREMTKVSLIALAWLTAIISACRALAIETLLISRMPLPCERPAGLKIHFRELPLQKSSMNIEYSCGRM